MSLTKVTNSIISGANVNILDYGADPTGTTDSTAAITAANIAACAGTIGLDGNTVVAKNAVYFPAGTYKVTGLTYLGAPWVGDGISATFIDLYASSGACINAVGTSSARKLLSISDISINGSNATGSAHGLSLGYNQRSLGALQRVRIDNFPGPAIKFDAPTWSMSFYDVYCSFNANGNTSLGTAIYVSPSLGTGTLLAMDWFNLQLENNGYATSGIGGGITLGSSSAYNWNFYGGVWESNYGDSEAHFVDVVGVHINGLYIESQVANVVNGLVFSGGSLGSVTNAHIAGETTQTGAAIKVSNISNINICHCDSNIKWANDVQVTDTAFATLSGYNAMLLFSVANGAVLQRLTQNRKQLTDASTIAVNASDANSFYVTLFDNRTMGAPINSSIGQRILFTIIQNGTTASCTLAWHPVYKLNTWSNTGNTANKRSLIEFEYDGTNWVQCSLQVPYF